MIKKILIALIVLPVFFVSTSYGQQKKFKNIQNFDKNKFHWGFYLGLNTFDFKLTPNEEFGMTDTHTTAVTTEPGLGFTVGLIGDMRLNDYINLRFEPGLSITGRSIIYDEELYGDLSEEERTLNIHSTYASLPVLVKVAGKRRINIRPYFIGGGSLNFAFSSIQNGDGSDKESEFKSTKTELFWEAGGGIDWYLPMFKLSTEIRGAFGINDILGGSKSNDLTDPIDKLQSRAVFFVLKFE